LPIKRTNLTNWRPFFRSYLPLNQSFTLFPANFAQVNLRAAAKVVLIYSSSHLAVPREQLIKWSLCEQSGRASERGWGASRNTRARHHQLTCTYHTNMPFAPHVQVCCLFVSPCAPKLAAPRYIILYTYIMRLLARTS